MDALDTSSAGFVVQVLAAEADARLGARPDPGKKPGQILDRMSDVSPRVERFEYVDSVASLDAKLVLTVNNWDHYFFEHPAWLKGNLVRFFWGYPGRIQGPKYAVVDSVRGFSRLTITCLGSATLSNEQKSHVWSNTTRAQIIATLVRQGRFPRVTKVAIDGGTPTPAGVFLATLAAFRATPIVAFSALLREKPRDFQQAACTAWQFALQLADDIGYELYVEDDALHFHSKELNQVPIRRYEWYTGAGDFLDFELQEWRAQDRAGAITVFGYDPVERKSIESTGSNATTQRDTLGKQGTVAQETVLKAERGGSLVGSIRTIAPHTDPASIKNTADAQFRGLEMGEIEATARVIGDPRLKKARLIKLAGVSQPLSGNYYIEEVAHQLDSSGYTCHMKLRRNAVTALPTTNPPELDPTKSKDNTQAPSNTRIVRDPPTGDLKPK